MAFASQGEHSMAPLVAVAEAVPQQLELHEALLLVEEYRQASAAEAAECRQAFVVEQAECRRASAVEQAEEYRRVFVVEQVEEYRRASAAEQAEAYRQGLAAEVEECKQERKGQEMMRVVLGLVGRLMYRTSDKTMHLI